MSNNTLASLDVHFKIKVLIIPHKLGVANGISKNVGLGKFCQDLKISEAFMISLEVSFFHGLFLLLWVSKLFTKESQVRISN